MRMSKKRICDICDRNEASRSFKIKTRSKGQYECDDYGISWNGNRWTAWENVDVCSECGEKLLENLRIIPKKEGEKIG